VKPLSLNLKESWKNLVDNWIIALPFLFVYLVTISFYVILGSSSLGLIIDQLKGFINEASFLGYVPIDGLIVWMQSSIFYLMNILIVIVFFHLLIGAINGAGTGNMFVNSVRGEYTDFGNYFEGVLFFTGRMILFHAMKLIITVFPYLLYITCLMAIKRMGLEIEGYLWWAVSIAGFILAGLMTVAVCFFTIMWKPIMFLNDTGVFDSMVESFRFIYKNTGKILTVYLMNVFIAISVSLLFASIQNLASMWGMFFINSEILPYYSWALILGVRAVNSVLVIFLSLYFSFVYYRIFNDSLCEVCKKDIPLCKELHLADA